MACLPNSCRGVRGRDATTDFEHVHSSSILGELPVGIVVGTVEPTNAPSVVAVHSADSGPGHSSNSLQSETPAPLVGGMLCLDDVERAAERVLPPTSYAYFATGAGAERTTQANIAAFKRLLLVPQVLVDVANTTTATTLLGHRLRLPLFVSAAARGKLAHVDGESCIARGCAAAGILQMVPQLGGSSLEEVAAASPDGARWLQLYVYKDRAKTLALIRRAKDLGFSALVITVDAPTVGKRLRDVRTKMRAAGANTVVLSSAPRAGSSSFDESLTWSDLDWFQQVSDLPVLLKGVQCGADAVRAKECGMAGIIVSNHGGRNLDGCRPTLRILAEVTAAVGRSTVSTRAAPFEVLVDGGIREGGDIIKALALGATAVGIGRPAIYGLAAFGQAGVEKVVDLLHDELLTAMKLMGLPSVDDISPGCIEAADVCLQFAPKL